MFFQHYTVNGEIFAELNILSFIPIKFSQEYFHGILASGIYYLTIAKYLWENFCGTLKNHPSVAHAVDHSLCAVSH